MYLSCYDILPVQCFSSFGTDCVFCLSNKHAAGQLSVKSHCQILPTHLSWAYLKNKVTCFTEWHIWLCIRHIWTISSTQVLDQSQYEEAHLPLSHTFLCGRSSSALHRWATAIEKCLGEVETGRNLLPKHLSEQHLRSHLPWCLSSWVLRTSVQEPQMSLDLVERSQAKSRADSQKTRLPKNNQLEKAVDPAFQCLIPYNFQKNSMHICSVKSCHSGSGIENKKPTGRSALCSWRAGFALSSTTGLLRDFN